MDKKKSPICQLILIENIKHRKHICHSILLLPAYEGQGEG